MSKWYPCVYCTEDFRCEKYSGDGVISHCVQGPCYDETPSNADRIRAMTDEELAEYLDLVNDGDCLYAMGKTERCGNCGGDGCPCWLEWLQKEADDEHTD